MEGDSYALLSERVALLKRGIMGVARLSGLRRSFGGKRIE